MWADRARAARMAYKSLLRLGINSLPVDPLYMLHQCSDTTVCSYADFAGRLGISEDELRQTADYRAESCTIVRQTQNGQRRKILYDSTMGERRLRFTFAHELGHIVLKHPEEQSKAHEREANVFASHLLYPRPVLDALKSRGMELTLMTLVCLTGCSPLSADVYLSGDGVIIPSDIRAGVVGLFANWIDGQFQQAEPEPPKNVILRVPRFALQQYLATGDLSAIVNL